MGTLRKLGKADRPSLGTLDRPNLGTLDRPSLGTLDPDRPTLGTPNAQTWALGTPKLGHSLARAQDSESFYTQTEDTRRRQATHAPERAREDAAAVVVDHQAALKAGARLASVYTWALSAGVPPRAAHGGGLDSAHVCPDVCERAVLRAARRAPELGFAPARLGQVLREGAAPSVRALHVAKRAMLRAAGVTAALEELAARYSYAEIRANVRHATRAAGGKAPPPAHVVQCVRANDAGYDFGARVERFADALLARREGRRPRKPSAANVAQQRADAARAQVEADRARLDRERAIAQRIAALTPIQLSDLRRVVCARDKRAAALPTVQQTPRMLAAFVAEHMGDLEDIERGARRVVPVSD